MSNFRWSFGIGPIRYNAPIRTGMRKQEPAAVGKAFLHLLILAVLVCCCCVPVWNWITE